MYIESVCAKSLLSIFGLADAKSVFLIIVPDRKLRISLNNT